MEGSQLQKYEEGSLDVGGRQISGVIQIVSTLILHRLDQCRSGLWTRYNRALEFLRMADDFHQCVRKYVVLAFIEKHTWECPERIRLAVLCPFRSYLVPSIYRNLRKSSKIRWTAMLQQTLSPDRSWKNDVWNGLRNHAGSDSRRKDILTGEQIRILNGEDRTQVLFLHLGGSVQV